MAMVVAAVIVMGVFLMTVVVMPMIIVAMIIMPVMAVIIVAVIVMVIVAVAIGHTDTALCAQQRERRGLTGERRKRINHPRRQLGSDPDHQIRPVQRARLRWAQRNAMRRLPGVNNRVDLPVILHHHGHQRLQRCDIHHHSRPVCRGHTAPNRQARCQNCAHHVSPSSESRFAGLLVVTL